MSTFGSSKSFSVLVFHPFLAASLTVLLSSFLALKRTATFVPDAIISSKTPLLLGKQELTSSRKSSWNNSLSLSLDRAVHLCNFNPQNLKLLSFPTRVNFEIKEDYNRCRSRCLEGNRDPKIQDGQPISSSPSTITSISTSQKCQSQKWKLSFSTLEE